MENFLEYIKGKKVTVMGLGLLGRGIGDAKFLAECGADVLVTDLKSAEELRPSVEEISKYNNVTLVLGEHRVEDFENADIVIRVPNAPLDSIYLKTAEQNGAHVTQSVALFTKFVGADRIIGVTGTRGKSTVTHLIGHVLKTLGKDVVLGGNVRGVSTLSLLPSIKDDTVVVLELDSWQLQSFGTEKISPHIAVFTTFMKDHMNYYKENVDRYLEDKAQIFLNQKGGDTLVIGEDIFDKVIEAYKDGIKARDVLKAERESVPVDWNIKMPGEHNLLNIACALKALEAHGVSLGGIRGGVESFQGVPGRLEYMGEKDGVDIYNDTNATTPDATIAALKALDKGSKKIILICGGADKELSMEEFIKEVKDRTKKVILLQGTGTEKIKNSFPDSFVFNSLKNAVEEAFSSLEPGDTVLFSPAFSSFGMFKNEYDRGDQFREIINAR